MNNQRPNDQPMLAQLSDIADRYLRRTLGDVAQLDEVFGKALAGESESVRTLEQLAHKIHGSSAMFGFAELSEAAGEVEQLVAQQGVNLGPVRERLGALLGQVKHELSAAAEERGIET